MNNQDPSASTGEVASTLLPREPALPPGKRRGAETFTNSTVRRMTCPPDRSEALFWDTNCRGFGLRALKSGRRSWIYQYRDEHGRTRRIALGDVSAVRLDAARGKARQEAARVAQGENPSVDRKAKRAAGTVHELIDAYLDDAKLRQRPRSYTETEHHLRVHAAPLHHDRAEAVHRRDITTLLERVAKYSGPVAANRLRSQLSALWSWGLRTGRIEADVNPVTFTTRNREKSRERTLTDAELKAIWDATDNDEDYSRIVRLCLLTGCRREEVGKLRWSEIRDDRIVLDPDRMKGDVAHEIAMLPMIAAALPERPKDAAGFVFGRHRTGFSGWSKSKKRLDAALRAAGVAFAPFGLQDLRRSFSTRLHDAGVEPLVIEALLAHKQQGVAAVYNRASFRDGKRAALMRWHELVQSIFTGQR